MPDWKAMPGTVIPDPENRAEGISEMFCEWGYAGRHRSSLGRKPNCWAESLVWLWPLFPSWTPEFFPKQIDDETQFPILFLGWGKSESNTPVLPVLSSPLPFFVGAFGLPLPRLSSLIVGRGLELGKVEALFRMESCSRALQQRGPIAVCDWFPNLLPSGPILPLLEGLIGGLTSMLLWTRGSSGGGKFASPTAPKWQPLKPSLVSCLGGWGVFSLGLDLFDGS